MSTAGDERYALTPFGQMMADAIQIADSSAQAIVECHCGVEFIKEPDGKSTRWCDTSRAPGLTLMRRAAADEIDVEDAQRLEQALRYLRARGRINIHPTRPELVNFAGVGE